MTHLARSAPERVRPLAAALAACLLAGVVAIAWPGDAGSAPLRRVVLGKTANTPKPSCPARTRTINGQKVEVEPCQAVGNATVFQSLAGDAVKPYLAPFDGKVVAWSISLSRPKQSEIAFFNDFYGGPAAARLAILKKVPNKRPPKYRLVRQSPLQKLRGYFGRTPLFALDHPLNVVAGQVVALTLPTWAPNWTGPFLSANNTFRSSRQADKCGNDQIQDFSHPQTKVGSRRQYGCYFTNSRLLYTATLVKKPRNG